MGDENDNNKTSTSNGSQEEQPHYFLETLYLSEIRYLVPSRTLRVVKFNTLCTTQSKAMEECDLDFLDILKDMPDEGCVNQDDSETTLMNYLYSRDNEKEVGTENNSNNEIQVDQIGLDLLMAIWNRISKEYCKKHNYEPVRSTLYGSDQMHGFVHKLQWNPNDKIYKCYCCNTDNNNSASAATTSTTKFPKSIPLYQIPNQPKSTNPLWDAFINEYCEYAPMTNENFRHWYPTTTATLDDNDAAVNEKNQESDDSSRKRKASPPPPPSILYLIETTFILPVYDTFVGSTTTIALTEETARQQLGKDFMTCLNRCFHGGQESLTGVPLEPNQVVDHLGADFIQALWNTCDTGQRLESSSGGRIRGRIHKMVYNEEYQSYIAENEKRPLHQVPGYLPTNTSKMFPNNVNTQTKLDAFIKKWEHAKP